MTTNNVNRKLIRLFYHISITECNLIINFIFLYVLISDLIHVIQRILKITIVLLSIILSDIVI